MKNVDMPVVKHGQDKGLELRAKGETKVEGGGGGGVEGLQDDEERLEVWIYIYIYIYIQKLICSIIIDVIYIFFFEKKVGGVKEKSEMWVYLYKNSSIQ